jgi:hypothetical protein
MPVANRTTPGQFDESLWKTIGLWQTRDMVRAAAVAIFPPVSDWKHTQFAGFARRT